MSFLLSFDLRDYPLMIRDLSPSVSRPSTLPRAKSFQDLTKLQPFCLRVSFRLTGICPFGAPLPLVGIEVSPVTIKNSVPIKKRCQEEFVVRMGSSVEAQVSKTMGQRFFTSNCSKAIDLHDFTTYYTILYVSKKVLTRL